MKLSRNKGFITVVDLGKGDRDLFTNLDSTIAFIITVSLRLQ